MEKRVAVVVDDDADLAEALAEVLRFFGFEVTVGLSVTEAMAALAKAQPDLVICDWDIGGQSGELVLRETERRYPDAARLLLTGSSRDQWEQTIATGLVHAALIKPFELAGLRRLLTMLGKIQ